MKIKVFNSLTNKKELLPPKKKLKLFVCGPTVYDLSHIGHARTYIFFDLFVKFLKKVSYRVFYIQNITDIDDKIINRAKLENQNPLKLSKKFTKKYLKDMESLGVNSLNIYAPATKFIPHIVSQVERLIKKGYAYKTLDGYYFNIKKFKDYGKLSKRTAFEAEDAVSRIDDSFKKINKGDFCLWKFPAEDKQKILNALPKTKKFIILNFEPLWKTSLGWGRPGWHIEDTAISEYYLGLQYDLHGGGIDLKFPHHEAEIAQAESLSGKKPFVKIWMHTGQLLVDGQKMSKSLGNFITIEDFLKKYKSIVLRFVFLMQHWQSPINYDEKLLNLAISNLQKIYETNEKIKFALRQKKFGNKNINFKTLNLLNKNFNNALADNINTPLALSYLFKLIDLIQQNLFTLNKKSIMHLYKMFKNYLNMLALNLPFFKIPAKIKAFLAKREKLRNNKQFMQADLLRNQINALGYKIEDSKIGAIIFYKNPWIQK